MGRVCRVAADRPELSTIAVNADPDQLYLGSRGLTQLRLITDHGVQLAGPGVMKDEAWQVPSWELLPDHPADVVLAHAGSTPVLEESAAYQSLPAIKAGQAIPWDDKSPYTHVHYAVWLNQLADLYRSADDVARDRPFSIPRNYQESKVALLISYGIAKLRRVR